MNIKRNWPFLSIFLTLTIYFGCGEKFDEGYQETMIFENPLPLAKTVEDADLNLKEEDSSNFSFHRIYNYFADGVSPFPYISVWSSYFDPGIVETGYPLYIWEHPFYTNARLWDAWGWNDDDDDDHWRHHGHHNH